MALSRARSALTVLADATRTQLWPLPTIGLVLGVALGVLLPRLDARVDEDLPGWVSAYIFGGGAGAARTVLDAVASSLITVTSLTFSLTVVTLQLASSQFSPRLLRTFTRDRFVHLTLALFLSTFTYALTVLRSVRDPSDGGGAFVPKISVTVAYLLALASVLALVLFLAHLAQEIRVETMLRTVHADASATLRRVLPELDPDSPDEVDRGPVPPLDSSPLLAGASGFLVHVDEDAILAAAVDCDAVVVIERHPGSSLIVGVPVGASWRHDGGPLAREQGEQLQTCVSAALTAGFERTGAQDVAFGLRQLADVTNKALSPGINDPTTAVHALAHSAALLCELARRDLGPQLLRDEDGRVRVVLRRPDLPVLLELALAQPRRYGAADAFVLTRIAQLLREVAWCVHRPLDRRAVADQLARLRVTAAAQDFDPAERERIAALTEQVTAALAGRWSDSDVAS